MSSLQRSVCLLLLSLLTVALGAVSSAAGAVTDPIMATATTDTTSGYDQVGQPLHAGAAYVHGTLSQLSHAPAQGSTARNAFAAEDVEGAGSSLAKSCLRSFAGTTLVLMADGTKKSIEDIKVGDLVVATDPETGKRVTRKVTHLWVHDDQLTDLTFADGTVLNTTEDHLDWSVTDQTFERADHLAHGEIVLGDHGKHLTVLGFRPRSTQTALAYNLSIAGVHSYHVGPDAIVVHNDCDPADLRGLSNSYVKKLLEKFDTDPHAFKEEFVGRGDVSKFDIKMGPGGELHLVS